jgi:hypothetical protein
MYKKGNRTSASYWVLLVARNYWTRYHSTDKSLIFPYMKKSRSYTQSNSDLQIQYNSAPITFIRYTWLYIAALVVPRARSLKYYSRLFQYYTWCCKHIVLLASYVTNFQANFTTGFRSKLNYFHPAFSIYLMQTNKQVHNYNTRNVDSYRSRACRTNIKQFTILSRGPKLWNSLPDTVISSFRNRMMKYLFDSWSYWHAYN